MAQNPIIPTGEETLFNRRDKYYTDEEGNLRLVQTMVCNRNIFNPQHFEIRRKERYKDEREDYKLDREALAQMSSADFDSLRSYYARDLQADILSEMRTEYASNYTEYLLSHCGEDNEYLYSAQRRAQRTLKDYIGADFDLKYFITLTLSGEEFARDDVQTACKKLNNYLRNRVQRDGLKYVVVPELHKDGAIHFHGLINDALELVDSGTVIPPAGGKPIKISTAKRKRLALEECKTVYNIPSWKYGFTTAIKLYGDRSAAAAYVAKYISKNVIQDGENKPEKIGGRYFFHSSNLRKPYFVYTTADYEEADGDEIEGVFGRLKIFYPD